MKRAFFATKSKLRFECQLVQLRRVAAYKCGNCGKGTVAHEPGGLLRPYCLVCDARITEEAKPNA